MKWPTCQAADNRPDYSIGSFAKLLKPMNAKVWNSMIKGCTVSPDHQPTWPPDFDEHKAVSWLIANGYIKEITYTELHLGDYHTPPAWEEA